MAPSKDRSVRRLRRFFSQTPILEPGQVIALGREESKHLIHVLRLECGAHCYTVDGTGLQAEAEVMKSESKDRALLKVLQITMKETLQSQGPIFFIGLPQKSKFEFIIEKAQELGLSEIVPMITEFTIVHPGDKTEKMMARWNRIAQEAAKQSGAAVTLRIQKPVTFRAALEGLAADGCIVFFHPLSDFPSLTSWLGKQRSIPAGVKCFIGPEGGFSDSEIKLAKERSAVLLSLGETILKVDTAFMTAASVMQLFIHDQHKRK